MIDKNRDVPRRIYTSTIERIDKHLDPRAAIPKRGKRKIKPNFNKFLIELLDLYEASIGAQIYYVSTMYEDPAEARGEAIQKAVKLGQPVEWPKMVIVVGQDEQS